MAAVTLVQELALEQPKIRKGVIKTWVELSAFSRKVPTQTTGALQVPITYQSGVPTAQLRFINEAVSTQTSDFSQRVVSLSIFESDIDVDPVLLANKNVIQRLDVVNVENKVKAMAYDFANYAINGDPVAGNQREPLGLKRALDKEPLFSGQTVNMTASATEHELRVGTATDAQYRMLLHKFNELMTRVGNDNKPDCFLVNTQQILVIWAALQQLKLFKTTEDQYDREIMVYRGVPFVDMGFNSAGALDATYAAAGQAGNQVIGNDSEAVSTDNGGNAYTNQTPIYALKFGDNFCVALQQEAMQVKPFGETEVSPHYFRTNVRWVVLPAALFQKRAAARLVGGAYSVAPA